MATDLGQLPKWDMTPYFPSLDSPEFEKEFDSLISDVKELEELFDTNDVGSPDATLDDSKLAVLEDIIERVNAIRDKGRLVGGYIGSFVTTDSKDTAAQAKYSELQMKTTVLGKLDKRLDVWIAALGVEELIERSQVAKDHAFALRKSAEDAEHQMTPDQEDLFADLKLVAGSAWGRLHGDVTSQLTVPFERDGKTEELPMSSIRALAADADPDVREAAYEAELAAWKTVEVPLGAALNSIKGQGNILWKRRSYTDSLEPALWSNNVKREALEAMQTAVVESFVDFRRYYRAKAKLLGKDALPWFDILAPVTSGGESKKWTWDDATSFVEEHFSSFSDKMGGMAKRAFAERWVDAEPRDGKRDGAFCMGVRDDESRVLMNFTGSVNGVSTLAHELGHAFHNVNLAERTPLQKNTPMALAETASIFCQTIVTQAALKELPESEKLGIIEADLQSTAQVVVDIHSRFLFEKGVYEGRESRDLSVDELNELMLDAQRQTYGDGLDPDKLHPYMWAVKPHYYGAAYYNWPYTFGELFGTGLYGQYLSDPEAFRANYDDLLSSTGMADAATLCARFDIDITTPDFWRSSLDVVRDRIEGLVKLAG